MAEGVEATDLPNATETEPKDLTPEHAADLAFYSFKYAQGEPDIQKNIFRYFHITHPDWKLTDPEATKALALKRLNAFMYKGDPSGEEQQVESPVHTNVRNKYNPDNTVAFPEVSLSTT